MTHDDDDCDVDSVIFRTDSMNLFRHAMVLLLYHRYGPNLPLAIFPVFMPRSLIYP